MSGKGNARNIHRKIIGFVSTGILLISAIVATVSIYPLYRQLINEQEKSLIFSKTTKTMAIEEFLTRTKDIAVQIASRTKVREKLEDYNAKRITLEELLPMTRKGLGDALFSSEEILGITRLDRDGRVVIRLGKDIPDSMWAVPQANSSKVLIRGPVSIHNHSYLVVGVAIQNKNLERVGTDIILFELSKLARIVQDYSGLGETGETVVGLLEGDEIIPLMPTRQIHSRETRPIVKDSDLAIALKRAIHKKSGLIKSKQDAKTHYIIAYGAIKDSDWGVAVKMDEEELYKSIQSQVAGIAILILCLILAGTVGMVLLLRPLAGKVILRASELEDKIKAKTTALTEKEARMRSIVETAAEGIISINEKGLIELFNPAAEKIFGYKASELIGENIKILVPEPHRSHHDAYIDAYLGTGVGKIIGTGSREVEGLRFDGSTFPMELAISEFCVDGHRKFTGMLRDITERKHAEEELKNRYDELKEANDSLKDTQNQLLQSEKMASIGQLAAGVAHEINNPVGYINSNVGTLQQYIQNLFRLLEGYEQLEEQVSNQAAITGIQTLKEEVELSYLKLDVAELISETQEGVTRVKQIVQDLKDFSHVDEAEWQWSDLHKGIDSTLNVARNEVKYKAEVVKEYGEIPQVECMPSQINQVFLNLLVNAAHAIENNGVIRIGSGCEGDAVWVSISDNGKGIPEEIGKRIFEPFFTTKPVGKGTGLGLSLSYGIVEKHGGRIELESELGKGTTFTVWLPIEQAIREIAS